MTDLGAGFGQCVHVINIQRVECRVDLIVQTAEFKKIAVGRRRGGETTGYRNTGACKITDHLAEGCVLAPHMLYIMDAELIEGNYVLYQGDLSTNCVGKAQGAGRSTGRHLSECGLDLENK